MAKERSVQVEQVPCAVCLREVPRDAAQVAEAEDYVMYFCGIDCYGKWKNREGGAGTASEIQVQQHPAKQ